MEHVPAPTMVAVAPEIVQTVALLDAKFTGRPDEALAVSATGPLP